MPDAVTPFARPNMLVSMAWPSITSAVTGVEQSPCGLSAHPLCRLLAPAHTVVSRWCHRRISLWSHPAPAHTKMSSCVTGSSCCNFILPRHAHRCHCVTGSSRCHSRCPGTQTITCCCGRLILLSFTLPRHTKHITRCGRLILLSKSWHHGFLLPHDDIVGLL